MFTRIDICSLDDCFIPYAERKKPGVYFVRLTAFQEKVDEFVRRYIEQTKQAGVCIFRKIGNPDEKQLEYYEEMLGQEFKLDPRFYMAALKKWMPRMAESVRKDIADSFYDIFIQMARAGKNENMQKNAYVKFMCWLYYRFEPVFSQRKNDAVPKILFQGNITEYELKMLRVLNLAGCDIVLLEPEGDGAYQKADSQSAYSQLFEIENGRAFPDGYSILDIRKEIFCQKPGSLSRVVLKAGSQKEERMGTKPGNTTGVPISGHSVSPSRQDAGCDRQRGYEMGSFTSSASSQTKPSRQLCTNAWMTTTAPFSEALKKPEERGKEPKVFYNLFAGVFGTDSGESCYQELLKWKMKLEGMGRTVELLEGGIPMPDFEEINSVRRGNYPSAEVLISRMAEQIVLADKEIQAYARAAFTGQMSGEKMPSQKLMNTAVIMICWLKRYAQKLWKKTGDFPQKIPMLFYHGPVRSENERLFLQMAAELPVDVMIVNPQGEEGAAITSPLFFKKREEGSISLQKFPTDVREMQFGTAAYQAEQELTGILYQDTGMYRANQFRTAIPVLLQTTSDEIYILWDQEAKYRPNFETFTDRVMVPVIFAKVSGMGQDKEEYWGKICDMMTEETRLVQDFPYCNLSKPNPFKEKAYQYLYNGKIDTRKLKNASSYPFGNLRESMQDYMLQKAQELIDSRLIDGGMGVENLILATILNMPKEWHWLIQNFDFTGKIPKALIVHSSDKSPVIEDSILFAYLHMLGFDVVIFVPTGYTCIERFYTKNILAEHQIGEYCYSAQVPDLNKMKKRRSGLAGRLIRSIIK